VIEIACLYILRRVGIKFSSGGVREKKIEKKKYIQSPAVVEGREKEDADLYCYR